MERIHFDLWDRCRAFVGAACGGRDASHGLAHMEKVTEQALLLYSLREETRIRRPSVEEMLRRSWQANYDVYRIILVAMLHDVADHKYDHDGALDTRVDAFVEAEAERLTDLAQSSQIMNGEANPLERNNSAAATVLAFLSPTDAAEVLSAGSSRVAALIGTSLKAISYSAEKKRGMRWFEMELPPDWCAVRDCVSDADKLEAIGDLGLLRCYEYTIHRTRQEYNEGRGAERSEAMRLLPLEQVLLQEVSDHFDEKLSQLLPRFIVTRAGKYLGAPRHDEMCALLEEWKRCGPPPVALYWRDAPSQLM